MKNWKLQGALLLKIIQMFCPRNPHDTNGLVKSKLEILVVEKSEVIAKELEQKFQTVEPQESEIIFETNLFVFERPKISCYQIESYIECNKVEQPALRMNIINESEE